MKNLKRVKLYFELFMLTVKNPRITADNIAKQYNYSGRGRSPSTFSWHIRNMYERKISREPQIVLKSHTRVHATAYLCEYQKERGFHDIILKLNNDEEIPYALALSSKRFFITSTNQDLDFRKYDMNIEEKSILYTPIYPVPKGWNIKIGKALSNFSDTVSKRGLLPRTLHEHLEWDSLDWSIYHKTNDRLRSFSYTKIARELETTPTTVRTRFLEKIRPKCVQINYFFPKGYDLYKYAFLEIKTDYESDIVEALEMLPCTSYVYPLENSLIIILFHEDIDHVTLALKKLEEKGTIESYLLYNALTCIPNSSI